jgi:uncharacterized protein (DUF58 family)
MDKLKKILIKTKKDVFSEYIGNNKSIFNGEGFEFSELREYQLGDDIKKIDWIITAKQSKPYIKEYKEERELNIVIANMLNGSVNFGTKIFKQEHIATINSILAYSSVKNSDIFSSYIFADTIYGYQKPTKKIFGVNECVKSILEFDSLNKSADYNHMMDYLFNKIKRKSLIFIVGDFIDNSIDITKLSKKHEVVCIVVRDRFEEKPTEVGFLSMLDPSSFSVLEGSIDKDSIDKYTKYIQAHDHELYSHFRKARIKFCKIYTDENPIKKLIHLFM